MVVQKIIEHIEKVLLYVETEIYFCLLHIVTFMRGTFIHRKNYSSWIHCIVSY